MICLIFYAYAQHNNNKSIKEYNLNIIYKKLTSTTKNILSTRYPPGAVYCWQKYSYIFEKVQIKFF